VILSDSGESSGEEEVLEASVDAKLKEGTSSQHLKNPRKDTPKKQDDKSDDSSGDEEVLEESTSTSSRNVSLAVPKQITKPRQSSADDGKGKGEGGGESSGEEEVLEESTGNADTCKPLASSSTKERPHKLQLQTRSGARASVDTEEESSGDEEVLEESTAVLPTAMQTETETGTSSLKRRQAEAPISATSTASAALSKGTAAAPSLIPPLAAPKRSTDSSSGDAVVFDRFSHARAEALSLVINALKVRAGLAQPSASGKDKISSINSGAASAGTWTVVATMSSFCSIPEVRKMASLCLDRWLGNPAIVESVRKLVHRIAECLEDEDGRLPSSSADDSAREGTNTRTPIQSPRMDNDVTEGKLIASDMEVVEEIVRLRSRLKASQIDLYKSILAVVAKRGHAVARLIVTLLMTEDVVMNNARLETVKLLVSVLSGLQDAHAERQPDVGGSTPSPRSARQSSLGKLKKFTRVGRILGEAANQICLAAGSGATIGSTGTISASVGASSWIAWTPAQSRILIDLLCRIVKSLGCREVACGALLSGMMGDPQVASLTVKKVQANLLLQQQQAQAFPPTSQGASSVAMPPPKGHPLDIEIFQFFADIAIALQLLCSHEIVVAEKELNEKTPFSSISTAAGSGIGAAGAAGAASGTPGASWPGRGVGMAAGRGGGRAGRVAALAGGSLPSIFRGSSLRAGRGSSAAAGPLTPASAAGAGTSGAPAAAIGASSSTEVPTDTLATLEARFNADRERLLRSCVEIQEAAAKWLLDVVITFKSQQTSPGSSNGDKHVSDVDPRKNVVLSPADADMQTAWLEWLQKTFCLHAFAISKVRTTVRCSLFSPLNRVDTRCCILVYVHTKNLTCFHHNY
jgi:hypothetical protein